MLIREQLLDLLLYSHSTKICHKKKMKYLICLVSITAAFLLTAQAQNWASKEDAKVKELMKKLREDLAKVQEDEKPASIESIFADEQTASEKLPGMKNIEKLVKAELQQTDENVEQQGDGDIIAQNDGPDNDLELADIQEENGGGTAKAQYYYYRYYVYYYRLYWRWRHYYYHLLRYYKAYRHLYYVYRHHYYYCIHHRG